MTDSYNSNSSHRLQKRGYPCWNQMDLLREEASADDSSI